jgi:uncharacterized protein YbjT (DUF2867 family)
MTQILRHQHQKTIVVIGGTGFVGTHVTQALANAGYRVHVVARDAVSGAHLTCFGATGQVVVSSGDVRKPETLRAAMRGAYGIIYLPGLLFQSGTQNFQAIHASAPEALAKMSVELGVKRFVFMSALGVNTVKTAAYATTKHEGEARVTAVRPDVTIVRPSVIFGADDNFLNQFARMATVSPCLPLIGGGATLFQPVSVEDVAQAMVQILLTPKSSGKAYEFVGADTLSFKAILQLICTTIDRSPILLPIPFSIASLMGSIANLVCPTPPLTSDQVALLRHNNIATPKSFGLAALGISPRSIYAEAPFILRRYIRHRPH